MKPDLFDYQHPAGRVQDGDGGVILQRLSAAEWQTLLGFAEQLSFRAGTPIVRAGESERSIYVVRAGRVRGSVMVGPKVRASPPIEAGAVFGELAFFDGGPRSASLWADTDCDLLVLPYAAFERLAAWHPRIARELLLDLGRVLATRLRRAEARS